MGAPKPTHGYPSRTAAVQALAAKGMPAKQIAGELGISAGTVKALQASARRAKRPAEREGRTVLFPTDILERLRPHAERRGLSVNELARRIVDVAAEEEMVDAILDDEVPS